MANVISPQATRRAGIPSRSIVLSDGLEWGFSLPSRLIRPRIVGSCDSLGRQIERVTVEIGFGYPLQIRRLIDRLGKSHDHGSVSEQYDSFMNLAVSLLTRCHDIDVSFACRLLTVSEEEFPALVDHVSRIISQWPDENAEEME